MEQVQCGRKYIHMRWDNKMSKWVAERIMYEMRNFYFYYVEDKPVVACGPIMKTNIRRNLICIFAIFVVCVGLGSVLRMMKPCSREMSLPLVSPFLIRERLLLKTH